MHKTNKFNGIDFSSINPEQIHRLVKNLYGGYQNEKRGFQFDLTADRRQTDRRQTNKSVLLDTRASRCRRQSSGRRQRDENHNNKHKVGIDYYV